MKIIRCSTNSKVALFDNAFKENIIIAPNSQVALQHLVIEPNSVIFFVNAENNGIIYSVDGNTKISIELDTKVYTKATVGGLLQNIARKINNTLSFDIPRNIGMQFYCERDNDRISIYYLIDDFDDGIASGFSVLENAVEDGTEFRRLNKTAGKGRSNDLLDSFLGSFSPFTKGCGILRVKVDLMDTKIGTSTGIIDGQNGFALVLSSKKYGIDSIELSDIVAGVYCAGKNENITIVKNGVETDTGEQLVKYDNTTSGNDFTKKDVLEIALTDGKLIYTQYVDGAEDRVHDLGRYDGVNHLYPLISLKGGSTKCILAEPYISYDRFFTEENDDPFRYTVSSNSHTSNLGATNTPPVPPTFDRTTMTNFLEFEDGTLMQFLGYDNLVYPYAENIFDADDDGDVFEWKGENVFDPPSLADCYAVEVMNIPLECYDGVDGGKRNIVAYVPVPSQDNTIAYEPANQNFINLNNRNPLSLRHIRARVLTSNLNPVKVIGTSSLALVIKEP